MPLTDADIQDLVIGTQKDLGPLRFNQIAQNIQQYEVFPRIMKKQKVKFESGNGIQRTLMVKDSGAARNVGLYEPDVVNVADVLATITIPWRHTTTNYAFSRREVAMNRQPSKLVDIVRVRRTDAMLGLAKQMESDFWSKPENSSDTLPIFGVQYWMVKNASEGFNGGAPSGFSDGCGGLTHDRWKNYTAQYTNVSRTDLLAKLRKATRRTGFESPIDIPDYRNGRGQQYRIYMNEDVLDAMEVLAEEQNDNLGRDLFSMDGAVTFKRIPLVWVPQLDSDTTDPLYMINWAYFHPVFLSGEYLRESKPSEAPLNHTVMVVHIDLTWNLLCTDRRRQAVLATA